RVHTAVDDFSANGLLRGQIFRLLSPESIDLAYDPLVLRVAGWPRVHTAVDDFSANGLLRGQIFRLLSPESIDLAYD
ncbi:hypothetical protein, partial [Escherichia coli]|uniref:hypothetical protein n=1 Tax=Escherichia coli TaxID=562 RepID=UPI0013E2B538